MRRETTEGEEAHILELLALGVLFTLLQILLCFGTKVIEENQH